MKKQNILKLFLILMSVFGVYYLSSVNSSHLSYKISAEAEDISSNPSVMARSFRLPSKFKGKDLPFHQIYEPRNVGFPPDLRNTKHTNVTKTILLWTPWNGVTKTINYYFLVPGNRSFVRYNCPNPNCVTTNNRKKLEVADAVLFHLFDSKSSDLPVKRKADQIWILYNMEPPWLIKTHVYPDLPNLKNVFNWTMSYRSDSDVISKYGFIMRSSERASPRPVQNKTRNIVWFVSDCKTGSKREDYVAELRKYIDVDIYGRCGKLKCYPAQSSVCYEEVIEKYKFYLSFENAICKDYVTEKFFNVFNYNVIPVVFGGAKYSTIGPEGTFIDATKFSEPRKLASALLKIGNDEGLYAKMLLRKQSYRAYLDPWMCRLCDMLHSSKKFAVHQDVKEWWMNEAHCKTWNKAAQIYEDVHYD